MPVSSFDDVRKITKRPAFIDITQLCDAATGSFAILSHAIARSASPVGISAEQVLSLKH
jgi:hypothetical protein